jgi:hypothetical protein
VITRLLLLATLFSCLLPAQVYRLTHKDGNGDAVLNITMNVVGGSEAGPGLGYAVVDIENLDSVERRCELQFGSRDSSRSDVASRRVCIAQPGLSRVFVPIAIPPSSGLFRLNVDSQSSNQRANVGRGAGIVGLFVSDRSNQAAQGLQVIRSVTATQSGDPSEQVEILPRDLPSDWRMLTSFSLVVVDGESGSGAGLSSDAQEALRRYAFAGGTVIVAAADSMTAGPLRDVARKGGDTPLAVGLGSVLSIPRLGSDLGTLSARLEQLSTLDRGLWPAAPGMFEVQTVAGLGKAPVTVFVMLILLFAILVGPVNFMILRRRKKPLLALLTVPLAGFGTTFGILAYGLFHDGLGARGVITTCTLLDQTSHEAVSLQARTLFAGVAPSDMTMNPGTLLLSLRAGLRNRDLPDRWIFDADAQQLDGGILPSRTLTPLFTCQQGSVRDRLTVRQSGDTLEVLPGGSVAPVGEWVLRDLDGEYWSGIGDSLQRVSSAHGRRQFASLRDRALEIQVASTPMLVTTSLPASLPSWGEPGTYICQVSSAAWIDDHGVSVDYDQEQHVVLGRMHAQDFVR